MRFHYQFFFFSFNSFYCVFFSLFLFYLGDHYHINSGIGPITLAQWDIYMNSTTHYPEETYFGAQPFGKVIGNISTHYDTFSTAEPDASLSSYSAPPPSAPPSPPPPRGAAAAVAV